MNKLHALRDVLRAFLMLGLTSFGGPVAHLGYFRREFVQRRGWLSEAQYAELVALCQFLPGPASSQVGFALGMTRAGLAGGLLAWLAFTLPSAALLVAFASATDAFAGPLGQSLIHGLKLTAVAVVAHAVSGMATTLCPDRARAGIALLALTMVSLAPSTAAQIAAITLGAGLGLWCCKGLQREISGDAPGALSHRAGLVCLGLFAALLASLPVLAQVYPQHAVQLFEAFYRAGALVFGGGHVVLPLLESSVVGQGWVDASTFVSGYGAAQAIPGPLFTFSAYLGAVDSQLGGLGGAALALCAIFLPGVLILLGTLPFWNALRAHPRAIPLMAGANAAVVGILAATLYDPIWTSAIGRPQDLVVAAGGFVMLGAWRAPAWQVVATCCVATIALDLLV